MSVLRLEIWLLGRDGGRSWSWALLLCPLTPGRLGMFWPTHPFQIFQMGHLSIILFCYLLVSKHAIQSLQFVTVTSQEQWTRGTALQ